MSTLTTKARTALPSTDFALPGRRYPIENKNHAVDAKARAQIQFERGKLSASDKAKVDAAADKVLKGG